LQSFTKMRRVDRDVLNELIEEYIPKLRSQLYDALRDVSIDADPPSEEPPAANEQTVVHMVTDDRHPSR
jgi:hypothetical protein